MFDPQPGERRLLAAAADRSADLPWVAPKPLFLKARSARDAHDLAHQKLGDQRRQANATLRKRISGLHGELTTLLEQDDARWAAFGFVPPTRRKRKAKASAEAGQQPVAVALKAAA